MRATALGRQRRTGPRLTRRVRGGSMSAALATVALQLAVGAAPAHALSSHTYGPGSYTVVVPNDVSYIVAGLTGGGAAVPATTA